MNGLGAWTSRPLDEAGSTGSRFACRSFTVQHSKQRGETARNTPGTDSSHFPFVLRALMLTKGNVRELSLIGETQSPSVLVQQSLFFLFPDRVRAYGHVPVPLHDTADRLYQISHSVRLPPGNALFLKEKGFRPPIQQTTSLTMRGKLK